MKELIKVEGLTKEYVSNIKMNKMGIIESKDVYRALNKVNFTLNEGEFIAVMGPSGAGKSTFVNLISTIDTPTRGKVYIYGENTRNMSNGKIAKLRYKTIGFVFQNFNLLDLLKNKENIGIPLALMNEKDNFIKERTEEIARKLSIEKLLEKYPLECSGGEKQRIAIARALVAKPKIIVADEPTGNLDSKNSKAVMDLFHDLNEKEGITILMVTHDPMLASNAKKVLYIKDGEINKIIERNEENRKEFFSEILNIVSEEAVF